MNANTSVGLGYSELIDSHRAGLQMERGFLTKSPWAQHGGRLLPPFPLRPSATPLRSFTRWAPNTGMMGVGVSKEAGWIRAQKDCLKKEGDTQKDESPPNKPSPAQALQRHLYVIRNA